MLKENFTQYLEDSINNNWDLPALSDYKGSTYYYKDVARKIARIHIMFEECEVEKGDKVALLGKNSANWAMSYLAVVTYGAVVVPILPDFHPDDMHHIINHSDSVILFVDNQIWENLDESNMPDIRAVVSLQDYSILIEGNREKVQKIYDSLNDLYTEKYGVGGIQREEFALEKIPNQEVGVLN
ncbi:MAG TPA: AMP-binding protein, partial [Bacteroidales bacterium]|nr:AMP-binding protein [Bacteroidales bacterium]